MKKEFTMSIREIVKETIVAFFTCAVLVTIVRVIAWPLLKWIDKNRKEKETIPSPESFSDVERANDVHFTEEEDHSIDQDEEEAE